MDTSADNSQAATSSLSGLLRFFSNPWVGVAATLASILGIPLAVYFYLQSVSRPELVYYTNPVRTVVVKQGTASRLTVSFDGHPLTQDVTAAQVAIWNRGRQAIRREAVLQPVTMRTEPRVPILEAAVQKKSREVVALAIDSARAAQGEVILSWNILEESDGGVVQLVYAATPETRIQCDGVIEGQAKIRELKYAGTIQSPREQVANERTVKYGAAAGVLVMLVSFALWIKEFRSVARWSLKLAIPLLAIALLSLIGAGFAAYMFMRSVPSPPFGFQ